MIFFVVSIALFCIYSVWDNFRLKRDVSDLQIESASIVKFLMENTSTNSMLLGIIDKYKTNNIKYIGNAKFKTDDKIYIVDDTIYLTFGEVRDLFLEYSNRVSADGVETTAGSTIN